MTINTSNDQDHDDDNTETDHEGINNEFMKQKRMRRTPGPANHCQIIGEIIVNRTEIWTLGPGTRLYALTEGGSGIECRNPDRNVKHL